LKVIFKDIEINSIPIITHYGDQKELNAFLNSKKNSQAFPLIWYVLNRTDKIDTETYKVKGGQLILMQETKVDKLNTERFNTSYVTYLNPLADLVYNALQQSDFVNLNGQRFGLPYADEPNFGLKSSDINFTGLSQSAKQKSITYKIVDAKILFLEMEIIPNCIIN
jgi:hypothetical protein